MNYVKPIKAKIKETIVNYNGTLYSVNDILIEEGHAYPYYGGKKKVFEEEITKEKTDAKLIKGKEE